ncbi:hypothetical protein KIPB_010001 [Kipferlia bialata]|uniref:Uncharacterized protein n=1 Tax=Kipferlia bialata TaxID=797122 RepID=A0A9K3GMP1_9EUKA|nr:hypothetical protein KIPB_010001 [Kipferlia bialata]|eukprot:g10001.t1
MQDPRRQKRLLSLLRDFANGGDGDEGLGYSNEVMEEDDAILARHMRDFKAAPDSAILDMFNEEQMRCAEQAFALLRAGRIEEYFRLGLPAMIDCGMPQAALNADV